MARARSTSVSAPTMDVTFWGWLDMTELLESRVFERRSAANVATTVANPTCDGITQSD